MDGRMDEYNKEKFGQRDSELPHMRRFVLNLFFVFFAGYHSEFRKYQCYPILFEVLGSGSQPY